MDLVTTVGRKETRKKIMMIVSIRIGVCGCFGDEKSSGITTVTKAKAGSHYESK